MPKRIYIAIVSMILTRICMFNDISGFLNLFDRVIRHCCIFHIHILVSLIFFLNTYSQKCCNNCTDELEVRLAMRSKELILCH